MDFAFSCDCAVGFTGFFEVVAGAASWGGRAEAANGASENKTAAEKSRNGFNMTLSSVAGVGDRHLAAV
jgi:hypothetical protein